MAILHMSEAEAANDFAALLQHVRNGTEIIIEDGETEIAYMGPARSLGLAIDDADNARFAAEVQEGLDCDPATDVDSAFIRAEMDARRTEALRKLPAPQA